MRCSKKRHTHTHTDTHTHTVRTMPARAFTLYTIRAAEDSIKNAKFKFIFFIFARACFLIVNPIGIILRRYIEIGCNHWSG